MTTQAKHSSGGIEQNMGQLTDEPYIDLAVHEDGSFDILTGDELFAHRYEQWVDTTREKQAWDRRFEA